MCDVAFERRILSGAGSGGALACRTARSPPTNPHPIQLSNQTFTPSQATPAAWWAGVPLGVATRLHLYNAPVAVGTPMDPLAFARALTRPGVDFLAFKLDITNEAVEAEFVDCMLNDGVSEEGEGGGWVGPGQRLGS